MEYKVTALKMGELTVDKSSLTSGIGIGESVKIPIWATAIEGGGYKILVDTGIHDQKWVDATLSPCTQEADETIEGALAEVGWTCDDVDTVINTHLHYDHCGNNRLFKHARFYIQRTEWENAYDPVENQKCFYIRELFGKTAVRFTDMHLCDGIETILDGIVVIPTPGHCKGHQSVLVNTAEGVLCVSGDAVNLVENIRDNVVPNILYNDEQVYTSFELIRRTADRILPGHEPGIGKFQTTGFPAI